MTKVTKFNSLNGEFKLNPPNSVLLFIINFPKTSNDKFMVTLQEDEDVNVCRDLRINELIQFRPKEDQRHVYFSIQLAALIMNINFWWKGE